MEKNKKKTNETKGYCYICPHCGNDAKPIMRKPGPIFCKYCGGFYTKRERIKIKM